ncbi:MAG: hypothetical protein EXR50_08390 [Dehalococcoidia bacterium]|nr:hypothetical protein [Dehalococcoidia bacterium]
MRENGFPDETSRPMKCGRKLEFYLLQRDSEDQIVVGGRWYDWPFPPGSFGATAASLDVVECPIISPEGLLDSKERWPEQRFGSPLLDKDA